MFCCCCCYWQMGVHRDQYERATMRYTFHCPFEVYKYVCVLFMLDVLFGLKNDLLFFLFKIVGTQATAS